MRKKMISILLTSMMLSCCIWGCGEDESSPNSANATTNTNKSESQSTSGTVDLSIWIDEDSVELTQKMVDSFCQEYAGQANFNITIEAHESGVIKSDALYDVMSSGDIIAFPDDQLSMFIASGYLEPLADQEKVSSENVTEAVEAASYNGTVYAFPYTADNGYFLYYNKDYLTSEDVQTLDRILEVAEQNEKYVSMEFVSGWYLYSFFGNTGLEVGVNADGVTNYCTWNSTENPIKGVDVAEALQRILASPAFIPQADSGFVEGMKNGTVIAGISGTWNAMTVKECWGNDYGAVKLPTYTVAGQQVQMASFTGYRMMGVNHYSKNIDWAMKLADWLTNEENQTIRFVEQNKGPSNINAAASDAVMEVPAIQAIIEQSQYGKVQRIGSKYWNACNEFTETLVAGNPNNIPLQDLMTTLVNGITESVAK